MGVTRGRLRRDLRRDACRDWIRPNDADLPILKIVKCVNLGKCGLVIRREADPVYRRGGQRRKRLGARP